ncbi:MAG: hypothetical protein KAW41_05600 [Candidatus Diapherotrites archaeon]|nr:hypothetical protein [Candidatus Diapherotrites archaeon]
MVDYTTIKSTEIKYGNNNFLEVARKEIEGNEFISLSKGYFLPNGNKRYKSGIGFPDENALPQQLADAILQMASTTKTIKETAKELAAETTEVAEAAPAEEKKEEAPAEEAPEEEAPAEEAPAEEASE